MPPVLRLLEGSFYSFADACQAVGADNHNILHVTVLQLVEDRKPMPDKTG